MTGPTRPTPPSALDGYRRLARTRGAASAEPVALLDAGEGPRRPRRPRFGARVIGTARLAGFLAVLVLIVATSVGLASADTEREPAPKAHAASREPATVAKQPSTSLRTRTAGTTARTAPVKAVAAAPAPKVAAAKQTADDEAHTTVATAAVTPAPPRTTLPFSGPPAQVQRILLGGSLLVLAGMLVQAAGSPLPARAHSRRS